MITTDDLYVRANGHSFQVGPTFFGNPIYFYKFSKYTINLRLSMIDALPYLIDNSKGRFTDADAHKSLMETMREAVDAYILHYIMVNKPWHYDKCRGSDIFWKHASKTSVYSLIKGELEAYTDEQRENDARSAENLAQMARDEIERDDNYQKMLNDKKRSPYRVKLLEKIAQYEKEGRFDEDVENDPEAPELLPDQVDYLCKKFSSKVSRRIANFVADHFFLNLIKKDKLVIDGVTGEEYLTALKNGAIVTCNHFHPYDNYVVFHCIRKALPRKYLYKVIREGNYTNFPGLYGYFFRHCNTLPLSRNRRTMMNFMSSVNTLLKRGESILIYPEQGMWWNYKKPRPFKLGGFKMAYRAGVPVLPTFITMTDDERLDERGYPIQRFTFHILPPIYPDETLGEKVGAEKMKDEAYALCKAKYEEVYGVPLTYGVEEE